MALLAVLGAAAPHASAIMIPNAPMRLTVFEEENPHDLSFLNTSASQQLPPVMMFAHGCSMTTAGIYLTQKLLEVHGVKPAATGHGELIKNLVEAENITEFKRLTGTFGRTGPSDIAFHEPNVTKRFEKVYEWAKVYDGTLVFKNELKEANALPDLMYYLSSINAKAFFYQRTNLIDVFRCMVSDFCDTPAAQAYGHNVDENGTEVSCEFRGRGETEGGDRISAAQTKVWLDPAKILENLQNQTAQDDKHMMVLSSYGINATDGPAVAEDLLKFEHNPGKMNNSVDAWYTVLSGVGVDADKTKIRAVLELEEQFPNPPLHSETLSNFPALLKALNGTKFYWMLRQ
jgi:hypothetical protein